MMQGVGLRAGQRPALPGLVLFLVIVLVLETRTFQTEKEND